MRAELVDRVVFDLGGLSHPDLATVDALAWLHLTARRLGHQVAFCDAYEELARTAVRMDLESVQVDVASLDDLIIMKRASGRARDRAHLEILAALRDEIDRPI